MEKYRFSNLTDGQHNRIIDAIRRMDAAAELSLSEAEKDALDLRRFLSLMESYSFVSPNERIEYEVEIERVLDAAAKKAAQRRSAKHDDTLVGAIRQSYGGDEK